MTNEIKQKIKDYFEKNKEIFFIGHLELDLESMTDAAIKQLDLDDDYYADIYDLATTFEHHLLYSDIWPSQNLFAPGALND